MTKKAREMPEFCGIREFAVLTKYSPTWVSKKLDAGMPGHETQGRQGEEVRIPIAEAIQWLIKEARTSKQAPPEEAPMHPRDRLAAESADRVATENAVRRGELCESADVEHIIIGAIQGLRSELDGIPGRLAGELTGLQPAEIRERILDNLRRCETNFAARLAALSMARAPDVEDGGGDDAAEETKPS